MTSIAIAPPVPSRLDAQRVVDFRQVAGLELDVDDRTDHLNDLPDSLSQPCCFSSAGSRLRTSIYSACAPDTTSMISRVIAA